MRTLITIVVAACLAFAPIAVSAQDTLSSSSSEGSSAGGNNDGGQDPQSDAPSTAEFIVSPFTATEASIEWTSAQLAATSTQLSVVMAVAFTVLLVIAAIGAAIYLSVRAAAANEKAFRHFLQRHRIALHQAVVEGDGAILRDFAALFGVRSSYPAFAQLLRERGPVVRQFLSPEWIESRSSELARLVINWSLADREVLREWLEDDRLRIHIGFRGSL